MGCSSSCSAAAWVHTTGLSLRTALLQHRPHRQPPSGHIHCLTAGSSMAACGDVPMGCRGTACPIMGLFWAPGDFSKPGTPPALCLHWPFGCRAVSLTVFSHTAAAVFFYTSLNTCHRDAVSFMDWLSFGQGKLELALPTRTILRLFSGGHPHSPFSPLPKPCYINLVLWDSVWCILWELWIFSDVINTTQSHTIKY